MIVAVPKPRQASTAQTRARIVHAAREMFIAYGYRSTSLRSIAVTAGVSHPGLLKHFASKDELLATVVDGLEDANVELYDGVVAASEPGALPFVEIARQNERTRGYLALFAALTGEASTPSHPAHDLMRARYARVTAMSTEVMEDAVLHGTVSDDRDPHGEAIRTAAAWDGLQLIEQYLPDRVDVVTMLEEREASWALPVGWRDPEGETPDAEAGVFRPMVDIVPAEDEIGYASGRRKRAKILADAMALFAAEGYGDTSLREIAEKVGVSKSTLMHHYPTKEALLGAVLAERDRTIQSRASYVPADTATAELLSLPAGAADNAATAPGLIEVYAVLSCEAVPASHPAHGHFQARFTHVIDRFAELFRGAQREGSMPAHRDPEHEAIWLAALWDGLQYQWLYDRDAVDVAEHLAAHLADVLPGRHPAR
ncbi:TetR/AcrR family transcriptional regulator [Microbacterium sp. CIAB417]|uniref:TetR/AcrR family transcriptional regulator n=1 Tax=Microbacterium sp. CIAB417 TaxID=2860287 RepID=UPI001FAC9FFC|nr:TetR/AcrR family transcriptional regulator [Microbacterium sp. CIAB417]